MLRRFVVAGSAWCVWMVMLSAQAFAGGADIGENTGKMLSGWAKWIFIGVAGLAAAAYLPGRKREDALGFVIVAIVLGGFVWAPNTVGGAIADIWKSIA
jgi:hypothetical protein